MKIIIGADHGGFSLKEDIKKWLIQEKYDVLDVGAEEMKGDDDFVDYASLVAEELVDSEDARGILFCRNGFGMMIAANRFGGVRCGLAFDKKAVFHGRNDDDINCLAIPADFVDLEKAKELVGEFLRTKFSDEERFRRRLWKLESMGSGGGCGCGGCGDGGCGNC